MGSADAQKGKGKNMRKNRARQPRRANTPKRAYRRRTTDVSTTSVNPLAATFGPLVLGGRCANCDKPFGESHFNAQGQYVGCGGVNAVDSIYVARFVPSVIVTSKALNAALMTRDVLSPQFMSTTPAPSRRPYARRTNKPGRIGDSIYAKTDKVEPSVGTMAQLFLDAVNKHDGITTMQLSKTTGKSYSTTQSYVSKLLKAGVVEKRKADASKAA